MKARMKAAAVLTLAALLILSVGGCKGDGPGPGTTVEEALAAMAAEDGETMSSFFTRDTRPYVVSGMAFILERIDEIRVSGVRTRVVSEGEGAATVEAEYDLETVSSGGTRDSHVVKTVTLLEEEGEWRISDLSLLE